jgi:chromosome segregation ATPase
MVYSVPDSALVMIEERYLPEEDGVLDWALERVNAPDHVKALLHRFAGNVILVRSGVNVEDLASVLGTPVIDREGRQAGIHFGMIGRVGTGVGKRDEELKEELENVTRTYSEIREEIQQLGTDIEGLRTDREVNLDSTLKELLSLQSRRELLVGQEIPSDLPLRLEAKRVQNTSGALADFKERMLNELRRGIQESERQLTKERKSENKLGEEEARQEMRYQRARERLERQLKAFYDLESKRLVLVDQMRSTKATIRDLDYRISKRREEVDSLVQNAEELSPRISSPRDLLELEKEISNIRGSLNELDEVPDDIEGVYKMYLSEFETLKQSLESIIGKREEMQNELRKGLGRWREIMNEYLEGIDRDFNEILGEIGGRGRVELVGEDVRRVGLDIWIGFEGKEMTSISTLAQSGGEKSLSTMAFLLALQRQIKSPFRAVDEYDVHLDPLNRNRVTSLLKSAVRRDSKQYIAITPSQISRQDLEDAENVVIVQSVDGMSRAGSLVLEATQ